MATPSSKDSQSPYVHVTSNDKGGELVQLVIDWYRGHRAQLSAGQQSAVITAITGVLDGTLKV